jgi:Ca-activated chloride channel family protein
MSFAEPLGLAAVLLVPAAALLWAVERRRRRRFAVRHASAAVIGSVAAAAPAWRRRLPPALLAAAAVALAVALARPQATVAVPVERASVMLVTDESGSMLAQDVEPSRLEAVQGAARSFMDRVPDRLLVGFAVTRHPCKRSLSRRPRTRPCAARSTPSTPRAGPRPATR